MNSLNFENGFIQWKGFTVSGTEFFLKVRKQFAPKDSAQHKKWCPELFVWTLPLTSPCVHVQSPKWEKLRCVRPIQAMWFIIECKNASSVVAKKDFHCQADRYTRWSEIIYTLMIRSWPIAQSTLFVSLVGKSQVAVPLNFIEWRAIKYANSP